MQYNPVYWGVRSPFGQMAWNGNDKARKNQMIKVLPRKYWQVFEDYGLDRAQADAKKDGAKDPAFPKDPSYCSAGNLN